MEKTANTTQVCQLRNVGNSLYLRIPAEFRHANNLRPGDFLVLDLTTVGIVRQADFVHLMKPALEPAE
jgi:hypothetical protein